MSNRFSGNPEFLVQFLIRCTGAERIHSDERSIGADDGIPALANRGFHADFHPCVANDGAPIFLGLSQEQFEAGHRDYTRRNAALRKQFCAVDRNGNFGTGGEDRDIGAAVGTRYFIGTMRADILLVEPVAQLREVLPREGKYARPVVGLECQLPALRGFYSVAGAEHQQIWNRPKRGKMLDRLVRRSIFAQADGVVGHHMDNALAHQRGESNCRTAVIGKYQKRAGVGNDAPVQRHAVHGCGHAVLAHAVVDEAPEEIAFMPLMRVLLEPVRSAEPPIISGSAGIRFSSANSQAVRVAISFGWAASFSFTARMASASACFGTSPFMRRSNSARVPPSSAAIRLAQSPCAPFERAPAARQAFRMSAGTSNGAEVQPSVLRAPAISSAPSGDPCDFSDPCLVGAPNPILVLQAISTGLSEVCAFSNAALIAAGSCPSIRDAVQPAASKRFT